MFKTDRTTDGSNEMALHCAAGGIAPQHVLPVVLDVGTNNERLLESEFYMGVQEKRLTGDEYYNVVEEFVQAIYHRWPQCVLQFEDFSTDHAKPLLDKYRNQYPCFNDDIQVRIVPTRPRDAHEGAGRGLTGGFRRLPKRFLVVRKAVRRRGLTVTTRFGAVGAGLQRLGRYELSLQAVSWGTWSESIYPTRDTSAGHHMAGRGSPPPPR